MSDRFRRFWAAHGASLVATELGAFVIPVLAVIDLDANAAEVGLIATAQWLPFLVLALPFGVIVDHVESRSVLVAAAAGRALLAGSIAASVGLQLASVPLLLVLAFLVGTCTVLYEVTYQSFVPQLVDRGALERANGRLQGTMAAAQVGAPGAGGVLVRMVGAPLVVAFEAVIHAMSAVLLASIPLAGAHVSRPDRTSTPSAGRWGRFWTDLQSGLRTLLGDRYLVALAGYSGISNLFEQWIRVLLTIYAVRELSIGAAGLGLALTVGAIGALLGASLVPWIERRFRTGRALVVLTALDCLALAMLPVIGPGSSWGLAVGCLAALWFLSGVGTASTSVIALTVRQLRTPAGSLGRVNAGVRWISYGAIAIGAAAGGLAGELLGTRTGLAVGGIGLLATIGWVALSPLARLDSVGDLQPAAADEDHLADQKPLTPE